MKNVQKQPTFLATCTKKYLQIGFLISIGLVIVAFKLPFYYNQNSTELIAPDYETITLEYLPPIKEVKEKIPPKADIVIPKKTEVLNFEPTEEINLPEIDNNIIEEVIVDVSDLKIEVDKVEEPDAPFVTNPEKMPSFIGGEIEMFKYVAKKVDYCESAIEYNIEGKVFIRFIVDVDGSIKDVEVVKGLYPCLDKKALDAVKNMPKWIPGEQGLNKVAVRMVLPVNFVLN